MFYAYKIIKGGVHITACTGLTREEMILMTNDGWIVYQTTDKDAHRDGMRLARTHTHTGFECGAL